MTENLPEQITAIKGGWRLAALLQKEHPEIVDLWREGLSYAEIARKMNFAVTYEVKPYIAAFAVGRAIAGHKEGWGVEDLAGLITDQRELEEIARQHNSTTGRESGNYTFNAKKGIHGQTKEELRAIGRRVYSEGKGVAAMSALERIRAGKKAALTRGQVPWLGRKAYYNFVNGEFVHSFTRLSEEEFFRMLCNSSHYVFLSGANKGRKNWNKIRKTLNRIYHNDEEVRSPMSLHRKWNKLKGGQ